jgi:hypothetical protein
MPSDDAFDQVELIGEGGTTTAVTHASSQYGSATTLDDVGRDRWAGTGKVEAIEGPTQLRVGGRSWQLEGLKPSGPDCMEALSTLVGTRKVVVEPTTSSHAYIRLMNRTLVNARLIRMGVADPDPKRIHRNRTRFLRYASERDQDNSSG